MKMFDKLSDIVFEPIRLVTDWAREPINHRQHKREMELQQHRIDSESKARMTESEHLAQLEKDKKAFLVEIEELRKDKDFARMSAVSDAIIKYQEHLTQLNLSAITAIGTMQLDLREKAQNLVHDKTIRYQEIQKKAYDEAFEEIMRIEKEFADNEMAKSILMRAVDARLGNIITTAQNFLLELNNDLGVLNKSINLLTERGQNFIQEHLGQFQVITSGSLLENNSSKDTKDNDPKLIN